MRDTAWMSDAACKGIYGLHFIEEHGKNGTRQRAMALAVCARCPVREECREYVLASPHLELGIWGGLTEKARARLRTSRRVRCECCGLFFDKPAGSKERMCSDHCRRATHTARQIAYQRRRAG